MGHATRCVPIINALIKSNFEPIIASDGDALLLLQKEFPKLKSYELPSYNIKYSKKGKNLKLKLLSQIPSIISAVKTENIIVKEIIEREELVGIISDNRFGVYSSKILSVYITHQLNVLSGSTTRLTSFIHQKIIKKFDECWVPDLEFEGNLSGNLGHLKTHNLKLKYVGLLSRFKPKVSTLKYDLLVLLSGPEPQRTYLENKLLAELKKYKGSVLFVRGVINSNKKIDVQKNINIQNYLLSEELEKAIIESEVVLTRSGYSSIMDLAVLEKKVFFIPTPGQFEQEYLARLMNRNGIGPYCLQNKFSLEKLQEVNNFKGFKKYESKLDFELFSLFNGK